MLQGPSAPRSIADALARASLLDVDVVVVTRGGGSEDDRLPFNSEIVARAIAACAHPVLTAIGHTPDHHIADDVADAYAPTPSLAATTLIGGFIAIRPFLAESPLRLARALERRRRESQRRVLACVSALAPERVAAALRLRGQHAGLLEASSRRLVDGGLRLRRDRLATLRVRLDAKGPVLAGRAARVEALDRALAERFATLAAERRRRIAAAAGRLEGRRPQTLVVERLARVRFLEHAVPRLAAERLAAAQRRLEGAERALAQTIGAATASKRSRYQMAKIALDGKNPEAILQQGYAIVRHDGKALRDAGSLAPGDRIEAQLARGSIRALVEGTEEDG
jgi:exodeoxyribonuclease VII large subunit